MAQFARPDGNITQTNFTGGFAEIDEATASDTDFAYGANNTVAELEVSLGNPTTPISGTCTVRYRIAKTNGGTVDGAGNSVDITCVVRQGTTQVATDTARTATGTWTEYSFTFDASAVTDWTDVRLEFTTTASGGSPANRRGGAVSWAELETPDATAGTEYTDSATITVDLQASGTELLAHDYVDSGTVYVLLSPSGVDVLAPTQTGVDRVAFTLEEPLTRTDHYFRATCSLANGAHTGVMRFQLYQGSSTPIGSVMETSALTGAAAEYEFAIPNADAEDFTDYATIEVEFYGYSSAGDAAEFRIHEMELQIPSAAPAEKLDSATIYLVLSVTSTDVGEFADDASVYVDLSIESIEERVSEDAQEVYLDLQSDSAELTEFVDTASVYADISVESSELADVVDSAEVSLDLAASGTDVAEFVDSAEAYVELTVESTEIREIPDSATVYVDIQANSAEVAEFVDTDTVLVDLQPSGTEFQTGTTEDEATIYLDVQPDTADIAEFVDTGEVYVNLDASTTDVAVYDETATVYFDLQSSGTEVADYSEAVTVYLDVQPASVELAEYTDSAETYLDLQASGTDEYTPGAAGYEDATTVPLVLTTDGVEIVQLTDEATAYVDLQVSGVELAELIEVSEVYLDIEASGTETLEHGYVDEDTVYLGLIPSSLVELFEAADVALVGLTITPTSTEEAQYDDSGLVYLDIVPGSVFVQVDFVLEIVGYTTRWTFQTRPEALLRWALLETRRFVWRF